MEGTETYLVNTQILKKPQVKKICKFAIETMKRSCKQRQQEANIYIYIYIYVYIYMYIYMYIYTHTYIYLSKKKSALLKVLFGLKPSSYVCTKRNVL